ncbi:COG0325 Predicted enzyme with a TIM-barrel fold [Candidatus Nanopelagicaceae bacterium]
MSERSEELERNLRAVEDEIRPYAPTLIVVTKTYPVSDAEILHDLGVRNFGENRSSEGLEKTSSVDATWHYQGEVQSKKLREISSWSHCIHSLDNLEHGLKLNRILEEDNRSINTFIQLSLDGDPSRGGLIERELFTLAGAIADLPQINLLGMMCVPPVSMGPSSAFSTIADIHHRFINEFPEAPSLSAGMSGDYMEALNHGATHIRVGSKILGSRQYH